MKERSALTILDAMRDPALFGSAFPSLEPWQPWMAFLTALFGLPMTHEQAEIYRRHTNRTAPPSDPSREAWLVVGRRGGKSIIAALVAVFIACFRNHRQSSRPGERRMVMVLAADREQAGVVFGFICGLIEGAPMLHQLVTSRSRDEIELRNGVTIRVQTASYRTLRGYTIIAAICDEIAFWRSEESANPDTEVLNALRPGMATVETPLLLCISSPYARRGALWEAYSQHFGREGDRILVWQAESRAMNPTLPERVVAEAYTDDEARASAEYGAQFRRDIEGFISREAVMAVIADERELRPVRGMRYVAFVDPSGGSNDSMTLAVAHFENGGAILDSVREWKPPFDPETVVRECAQLLKTYGISSVTGDRFGGEWVQKPFRGHGIQYEVGGRPKSDLYLELLPLINSGQVRLLNHPRLVQQLCGLERRVVRSGRESIGHPPGHYDDLANAVAGALVAAAADPASDRQLAAIGLQLNRGQNADGLDADVRELIRDHPDANHITGFEQ